MKRFTNEFKVGIFVILCILGLLYLTYKSGKFNFSREGYTVSVIFDKVMGLDTKAPVRLNGVEVGKVQDIKMLYDKGKTQVLLTLWLRKEARIREGAKICIKTLGLMGEKYVDIESFEGEKFIKPGDTLYGYTPPDLDKLMEEADKIAKNVNSLLQEAKKLTENLNGTVQENRVALHNIVKNLESTSKTFEEFSEDIKRHPWKLLFRTKEKKTRRRR